MSEKAKRILEQNPKLRSGLSQGQKWLKKLIGEIDSEKLQALDERWAAEYGEPFPREIEDLQRLLRRSGLSSDTVFAGKYTYADVLPIVEGFLQELQDKQPESHGDDSRSTEPNPLILSARFERAYQSFLLAETKTEQTLTDQAAYEWLCTEGPQDYELPDYRTWRRYVREGRRFYGTQKNAPRAGRLGRSIVTSDEARQTRRER